MSCKDPNEEINQFVSFIGQQIGCSRAYIFEVSSDGSYRNTYEWCNTGIASQMEHLQCIPLEDMSLWLDAFSREGRVFVENVEAIPKTQPAVYRWLRPQGIQSLLAYPLFGGRGFFGIDNPVRAFLSQTSSLMEIMIRFVETMLQRRDMTQELRWASLRDDQFSDKGRGLRFQIDVLTGRIQYDSDWVEALGYDFSMASLDELEEFACTHPELHDHLMIDGIERALESKENLNIEFVSYRRNQQLRWNRLTIRPFFDSKGTVIQLYGMLRDVSSEHRMIEQYNRYISHLAGGMHVCYLSQPVHLAYASDDLCEFLGYTRAEFGQIVGSKYTNIMVEEDRASFRGYAKRLGETPGIETCEYRLIKKDGSTVWVIDTMESVRDSNGVMYGYSYVLEKSQLPVMLEMAEEKERQQLALLNVQYEVVESLCKDYLNIFRVCLDEDKAQIVQLNGYVTKGMDKASAETIPYYRFCQQYIQDRVHPEDQQKMLAAMHPDTVRKAFSEQDEYLVVYRAIDNGETHFYQLKYVKLHHAQNDAGMNFVAGFKNVDKVVAEERARNEELRNELNIIEAILGAFTCGYYLDYEQGSFAELSCEDRNITEIVGKGGSFSELYERTKITFPDSDAFKRIYEFLQADTLNERLDGQKFLVSQVFIKGFGWYEIYLFVVDYDEQGKVSHCIYCTRNINKEKLQEEEYARSLELVSNRERSALKLAYLDVLTQAMNRNAFERDFHSIVGGGPIGFVYCDVNGLKDVNDIWGHNQGDRLLQDCVALLKEYFSVDCIYRIGGDEFVCMIGDIGKEGFEARVDEFTQAVKARGCIAAVGSSYGDSTDKDSLLRKAESEMYEAKRRMGVEAR